MQYSVYSFTEIMHFAYTFLPDALFYLQDKVNLVR